MRVRLKVVCHHVATSKPWRGSTAPPTGTVVLSPVHGGSAENDEFFAATPSGELRFNTVNEAALAGFEPGAEYYVTIEPVAVDSPAWEGGGASQLDSVEREAGADLNEDPLAPRESRYQGAPVEGRWA